MVATDVVDEREVEEAGCLDLAAVGPGTPVRHQVDAKLAFRGLNGGVGRSSRNLQKKMNELQAKIAVVMDLQNIENGKEYLRSFKAKNFSYSL